MPFKERESHPISNKDIVSFALDDPDYDIDKPVSQTHVSPMALSTTSRRCSLRAAAGSITWM